MKYFYMFMMFFLLLGSCKKDKPVDPCAEIECSPTTVSINNKAYVFNHLSAGTANPGYIDFIIYNVLYDKDDLNSEVFSVGGLYPITVGRHSLNKFGVYYYLSFKDHTKLDDTKLVEDYDNWIEIKEICNGGYRGTAHCQLEVLGGKKSYLYNTDTLNIHFDFSVCN